MSNPIFVNSANRWEATNGLIASLKIMADHFSRPLWYLINVGRFFVG